MIANACRYSSVHLTPKLDTNLQTILVLKGLSSWIVIQIYKLNNFLVQSLAALYASSTDGKTVSSMAVVLVSQQIIMKQLSMLSASLFPYLALCGITVPR